MCRLILTHTEHSYAGTPSEGDLMCPACQAVATVRLQRTGVQCLACGWNHTFTAPQRADLRDALLGTSDLHIPNFLLNLHVGS